MPRRLPINLDELLEAFDNASSDFQYHLDLETGQVVLITADTRKNLDDVYDHLLDFNEEGFWAVENVMKERGYTEEEQRGIFAVFLMEGGWGLRYQEIPRRRTNAAETEMKEFAATVQNAEVAAAITKAMGGRNPYREFRDALAPYPSVREQWESYRGERTLARVMDWLRDEGIEVVPAGS